MRKHYWELDAKFEIFKQLDRHERREFLRQAVELARQEDPDGYYLHALTIMSRLIEKATEPGHERDRPAPEQT